MRPYLKISIHALREEGDLVGAEDAPLPENFYPRPPRGGRLYIPMHLRDSDYFYPRPPRGGRLLRRRRTLTKQRNFYPRPPRGGRRRALGQRGRFPLHFYPRPPRGGRLNALVVGAVFYGISIHALREEGD